jgi:hypothetical protein
MLGDLDRLAAPVAQHDHAPGQNTNAGQASQQIE